MAIRFNSSIRQERGEHYVDYVRRNTSTRRLVDPERLVHDLAHLNDGTPHSTICNLILHQYEWREMWVIGDGSRPPGGSAVVFCVQQDGWMTTSHHWFTKLTHRKEYVLRSLCLRPLQLQCVWTFILVPT